MQRRSITTNFWAETMLLVLKTKPDATEDGSWRCGGQTVLCKWCI